MKSIPLLFLLSFSGFSQNIVLNPSFEETKNCNKIIKNYTNDVYEWSSPTFASPDLFNGCETSISDYFQTLPNTGENCSGIIILNSSADYSEYIQGSFSEKLVSGIEYYISFYLKLGNIATMALDKIGFLVLKEKLSFNNSYALNKKRLNKLKVNEQSISHIKSDSFFDEKEWVKISRTIVANGGEKYLLIGNFEDLESLKTKPVSDMSMSNVAYYFIDVVSVIKKEDILNSSRVNELVLVEEDIKPTTEYTFKNIIF